MLERRSQKRFLDTELVMLSWMDNHSVLKQLGNVEDVCSSGMGVIVRNTLEVRTPPTLTYGDGELTGVVRHSSPRVGGHLIGIELDLVSRSSPRPFHPRLLVR